MPLTIDETGNKYGKWTVLKYAGATGRALWLCRCTCGAERIIAGGELRRGKTKACRRCGTIKHGHTTDGNRSSEYESWSHMIQRCHSPKNKDYPNYGGRGITVCPEWRFSFADFLKAVGLKPSPELTIERIENDRNYEPGNVKWASRAEQANNQRKHRRVKITIGGETRGLIEWLDHFGTSYWAYRGRMSRGWDQLRAITTPSRREILDVRN